MLDWVRNCRVCTTKNLTFEQLEWAASYSAEEAADAVYGPAVGHCTARASCPRTSSACARAAGAVREARRRAGVRLSAPGNRRAFRRAGFESYGSTEMGPIAHECPHGSRHIMADHVRLEIFNGDSPAAPGEFGDIVVTSLFNRAMPLVRCRIGDRRRILPIRVLAACRIRCCPSSSAARRTCSRPRTVD